MSSLPPKQAHGAVAVAGTEAPTRRSSSKGANGKGANGKGANGKGANGKGANGEGATNESPATGSRTIYVLSKLVADAEFCAWFDRCSQERCMDPSFWHEVAEVAARRWAAICPDHLACAAVVPPGGDGEGER